MARRKPAVKNHETTINVVSVKPSAEVAKLVKETLEQTIEEALESRRPTLEEQIADIREGFEACRVAVMSVISPPKVEGKMLPRCRCGDFATQTRVLTCRINGTHRQDTCDACEFASPLVGLAGVTLLTPEPLPEAFVVEARRQNAARARVREVQR